MNPEAWNALLRLPCVHHYIQDADYAFYQYLVDVLMPDVSCQLPVLFAINLINDPRLLFTTLRVALELNS